MLAHTAPWYMPVLFLACLSWVTAFSLGPALTSRPWVHRLYVGLPPLLLLGLLLDRSRALFSLESTHPEVALVLGSSASWGDRWQQMFTGQGAIEGALLTFMVFAAFSHRLPSLRTAQPSTQRHVRYRMMTHAGWWSMGILIVLFPASMYDVVTSPPLSPTANVQGWTTLGVVVCFTLLLMMSGELLAASTHLAINHDTLLLQRRALLKTSAAGLVCWGVLLAANAYSLEWWSRPDHDLPLVTALLIAAYASLVACMHVPMIVLEGRFHTSPHPTITLASTVLTTFVLVAMTAWTVASDVALFGEGVSVVLAAWSPLAGWILAAGLLMVLPSLGFDAAHRPEAWWFRMSIMAMLPLTSITSISMWLLLPGFLIAGSLHPVMLIWMESSRRRTSLSVTVAVPTAVVVGLMLAFGAAPMEQRLGLSVVLMVLIASMSRWLTLRSLVSPLPKNQV